MLSTGRAPIYVQHSLTTEDSVIGETGGGTGSSRSRSGGGGAGIGRRTVSSMLDDEERAMRTRQAGASGGPVSKRSVQDEVDALRMSVSGDVCSEHCSSRYCTLTSALFLFCIPMLWCLAVLLAFNRYRARRRLMIAWLVGCVLLWIPPSLTFYAAYHCQIAVLRVCFFVSLLFWLLSIACAPALYLSDGLRYNKLLFYLFDVPCFVFYSLLVYYTYCMIDSIKMHANRYTFKIADCCFCL